MRRSYTPRGVLAEVFGARDPEVLVAGPAGTGKSRACLEKMHIMALINPGFRGLIVRKTAVSLTGTALVTFREHVAAEAIAARHCEWYGGSAQEAATYRYANGSIIAIGGMDKPVRIMSSEYDCCYVQEATELTVTDWEAITTRLRNGRLSFQQLIADCNPDAPFHWLKVRCDEGRTRLLNSRHEDNPRIFNDDGSLTLNGSAYIAKLDALTGVRYRRLRRGEWAAAEGQVYEQWDSAVHLVDRFEVPADWARYWSIDFGFTHPFVCQMWAEDPDGRLFLYREIFMTRRTVDEHARMIMEITKGEPRPQKVIADHDAEGRATWSKETGMPTTAARKAVIDGIQAVQRRLRDRQLFIMRDAVHERDAALVDIGHPASTADEVLSYVWAHTGVKDPLIKEEPVKDQDDGMDAMRYVVMDRERKSVGVRFL